MREATKFNTSQDYDVLTFDNVVFICWRRSMPVTAVPNITAAVDSLRRARVGNIVLLTIVEPDVATSEAAAREGVAEFLRSGDDVIKASALIIPGQGLRATWARSIATTITLASRTTYPTKCFADVAAGLQWLNGHLSLAQDTVQYLNGRISETQQVA